MTTSTWDPHVSFAMALADGHVRDEARVCCEAVELAQGVAVPPGADAQRVVEV